MKTLEQMIAVGSVCADGRDMVRLGCFMTADQIEANNIQFDAPEHRAAHVPKEWTRENILKALRDDVEFAFEKAFEKNNMLSVMMFECVRMWNNALEEGLENYGEEGYNVYGLPLYKATALKYGWPNPIGEDTGTEEKYDYSKDAPGANPLAELFAALRDAANNVEAPQEQPQHTLQ